MALPFEFPLKDPVQAQQEYDRVFDGLKNGQPVPSHIWLVIVQNGVPDRQWTLDRLPAYLSMMEKGNPEASIRKVWAATPTIRPSNRKGSGNVRMVLRGGTPINLTDFIWACCRNKSLLAQYEITVAKLVLTPFSILRAHRHGMTIRTRHKLTAFCHALNP